MPNSKFAGLSQAQQEVLTFDGWRFDARLQALRRAGKIRHTHTHTHDRGWVLIEREA